MIYLDEFILLNFIIDYILLNCLKDLLKINTRKYRLFLSSLIGEITILSLFFKLNNHLIFIINIIICMFMIVVAFGYTDIKTLIKNTIYFYILNFFIGGCLFYFKNEKLIKYRYLILLVAIIMKIYKYFAYNLKNIVSLKHKVTVYLNNGKVLYLNGYMDTANTLIEPYGNKKVIIINKNIKEDFFYVPYRTIDNSSLIKCFNPKRVYIDGIGERNDVCIGIINQKFIGYNCLLNYKLMEE